MREDGEELQVKKIGILAACFFSLFFFGLAVRFCAAAQQYGDTAEVMLEETALTGRQAEEICEREREGADAQGCCFWGELEKTELFCRETGSSSTVKAVLVTGNPELIRPGCGALAYQERGCILDEQTAQELFGTQQAEGQLLWCRERSYVVCGTVESLNRILIRKAEEADGAVLDHLSLSLAGNADGSSVVQQFLIRCSLSGRGMDSRFLNALASDFLLLLPLLFGGWLVYTFFWQGKRNAAVFGKVLWFSAAGLLTAAVLFLVVYRVQIPADMLPTKWSDFSFWEQWWETNRANLLLLLGTAKGEAQLAALWNLGISIICSVCSVLFGLPALTNLR